MSVSRTDPAAALGLPFSEHFESSAQALRGALTGLLASVSADPDSPQDVARRFGLNKNLTWKVARLVNDPDPYASAPHVPGEAGFRILLEAFDKGGAPTVALDAVRAALADFDRMVARHTGDRTTLQLALASMRPERVPQPQRDASRRQAFEGASGIWGVQARVRLAVDLVAPSAAGGDRIDIATLSGMADFRRLRPNVAWSLARFEIYDEEGPLDGPAEAPIAPAEVHLGLPVLREFSSDPLPSLRRLRGDRGITCELAEGPVGNTGAFTCVFGSVVRDVGPYRRSDDAIHGEHAVRLDTPVEWLVFDVLLHRDLVLEETPEALLTSSMQGRPEFPLDLHRADMLPLAEGVVALGDGPPILASPQLPDQSALVERACGHLGWDLRDFRGWRLTLRYPPIPTFPVIRYPLPG